MNYENTIIDNQAILEFRDGVEREVRSCTDALKRMAQKIQQMQMLDGFEGEAAESIKTYFSEVHLFLLEAIGEALTECESMLNQYAMEILCNVDSSPYARIPVSDLLGMQDQVKSRYLDMDETIDSVNNLMNGIQDLVQVNPIQTEVGSTGGLFAMPEEKTMFVSYDRENIVKSAIVNGNHIDLLEHCEEVRSILKESVDKIDRINFDYAMDKIPILEDYVKILDGSLAEYSDIARDMEKYHSGDYNKWDSTKCLSDQMLLYSLYYTTNQEEILLAKETLQQVSMEMQQVENKAKKDNTISVAKEIGSFGISLIPFLGDGKDLQESISGLDLITGKKLSALERVLAGACVIVPVVSGSMVRIAGKNADIAEKMSLLSEKQLFKKAGKGIAMCEDAKKEMEQLIREVRNMLEEDADIKRLFAKNKNTGPQVEIAGVGKVSLEEAEKLVGKDVRWSRGESGSNKIASNGLKIINGKVDGKIPLDEYQDIFRKSVHNENSDTMTLGKFRPTINPDGSENWKIAGNDSYNVIAHSNGDMYFDMKDGLYDATLDNYNLSYQNMFDDFNVPALDMAANAGKTIRFTHNPELKEYAGTFTDKEWKYLQKKWGYLYLREEGGFWYAEK